MAVARIREKHGYSKLQRGIMYEDKHALEMDVRGERLSKEERIAAQNQRKPKMTEIKDDQ